MVDLSTNLFNALPIRPVTRAPASLSLAKQDETNSGGNSLKTALTQSNSIVPKTPTETGFSSLAPVLASLRPPPFELEQINSLDDEPTFFDKLLEQQEGIVLARQENEARSEQVIKDRERDAAELIENEDKKHPLSDQDIAKYLASEKNLSVSRRTVAKYREELKILSSTYRRER